jgi:hypothetical protein
MKLRSWVWLPNWTSENIKTGWTHRKVRTLVCEMVDALLSKWLQKNWRHIERLYWHMFEWLRRGFGLVIAFIWSSLVVTTNNCNTFKITLIKTYKVFTGLHQLRISSAVSYRELNWKSQSQSHIATDGHSVSKSWCQAPSGAHDQIFITVWQLRYCSLWGALSDERSLSTQSQSHIATDGHSVSQSWCRAPSGAHDQIFISVWQLRSCFYGAPFLTRGLVCHLYMPLALANAVFLGSRSLGIRDQILLSQIWDFPFRRLLQLAGSRWRYSTPPPHG